MADGIDETNFTDPKQVSKNTLEHASMCRTENGNKVARRICNDAEDPIFVSDGSSPDSDSWFLEDTEDSVKDSAVVILDYTVAAGKILRLKNVKGSCSVIGFFDITADGDRIGIIRVGAAKKNGEFKWDPTRDLVEGTVFRVSFTAQTTSGKSADSFLQAKLIDA